jgi:hypothetical protein
MLESYALNASLTSRLFTLAEFRRKMAEHAQHDETLKRELLAAAPQELRELLEEEGVLRVVIECGQFSTKIRFGQRLGDRFGDFAAISSKFGELRRAWRRNVIIVLGKPERERVEVFFAAVYPTP